MNLLKKRKNIYSQNGEDGIIEYIIGSIGITKGTCCEFGAVDGKHLSNTFNLIKNHNWNGIFIEGDKKIFNNLLKTEQEYPDNIIAFNYYVEAEGVNSLDNILKQSNLPVNFDLLSIDIDSYDYAIWDKLREYQPKIVIIEINSTIIPPGEEIQDCKIGNGSSFSSMVKLGIKKGYTLLCNTGNLIFLKNDLIENSVFREYLSLNTDHLFIWRWVSYKDRILNINKYIRFLI